MKSNTRRVLLSAAPAVLEGGTLLTLSKLPAQSESKEPPKEFLMWEFGEIETTKGTFTLTKENAAEIVRKVQERGLELAFDYEHATFNPTDNGPVPAAGWHTLELRNDGLWLSGIEWTETAADMIKKRELRYYSPAFEVNDANEIVGYLNCALTNFPATKNLKPLVASARAAAAARRVTTDRRVTAGALSFDDIRRELSELLRSAFSPNNWDVWIVELYDEYAIFEMKGDTFKVPYTASEAGVSLTGEAVEVRRTYDEVTGGTTMKGLLVALGLKDNASEGEGVTLARDLMGVNTQLLSLTGAGTPAEALGVLQGWKANSERLPEVQRELTEAKENQDKEARTALIQTGMKDGKIPPALEEYWMGQPTEAVRQFLSAVMPNPAVTKDKEAEGGAANGQGGKTVLTGGAADVAKAFGNSPAKVAEYVSKKEGGN